MSDPYQPKALPGTIWTATNYHASPKGPKMPTVDPLRTLRKKKLRG